MTTTGDFDTNRSTGVPARLVSTPRAPDAILAAVSETDATAATTLRRRREHRADYVARINRAMDFIERNLDQDLTLEQVAKAAYFSPFHFHRVFGAIVGETAGKFVQRVRIERAASLLVQHPRRPVTAIAVDCGFSSPAVFARAFKQRFGMSATDWRRHGYQQHKPRDPAMPRSFEPSSDFGIVSFERDARTSTPRWRIRCPRHDSVVVEVCRLPSWTVAYVRHTGRYQGMGEVFDALFTKLMKWAVPRGLMHDGAKILSVYHDDPGVTDDENLRVSACVTVPEETEVGGDVGKMRLDGGDYAVGRFVLGEKDYGEAWHAMMGGWLPESGYEPADRACFEMFDTDCDAGGGRHVVDICVPVRPLRSV